MNKTCTVLMITSWLGMCGMAQAAFVTINNAGNADDTTGYGGVAYEYKISAHEVTIAEFAVSGAGDGDEDYWNDGTRTVGTNAPASYVSLYEAMKYCNYLTSGNINSGYYSTSDGGATYQANALAHDAYAAANGVTYFVPTEDEWHKAAYWTGPGYSDYSNGDDVADGAPTHGTASGWNYKNGGFVNPAPNFTWGCGFGGEEQNGTYNMMGNLWEWMEDSSGVQRGGWADNSELYLRSSNRNPFPDPANEYFFLGFRPVEVGPQPATAPSLVLDGLDLSWQSKTGQDYGVLTTTNLVTAPWAPVVPGWTNSGTGDIMIYTNSYPEDSRFFKVDTWIP